MLLEGYYDSALNTVETSVQQLSFNELERLSNMAALAVAVERMPRRDRAASFDELAREKKVARRINNMSQSLIKSWNKDARHDLEIQPIICDDVEAIASTVDWDEYVEESIAALHNRARIVITTAMNDNNRRFANRALNRYNTEMDRLAWTVRREG